jgi:hypothetical protein
MSTETINFNPATDRPQDTVVYLKSLIQRLSNGSKVSEFLLIVQDETETFLVLKAPEGSAGLKVSAVLRAVADEIDVQPASASEEK